MGKKDIVWTASVAIGKNLDYEALYYSDYMYGKENSTDEVWGYVVECREIGEVAFREKYKEFKLY